MGGTPCEFYNAKPGIKKAMAILEYRHRIKETPCSVKEGL